MSHLVHTDRPTASPGIAAGLTTRSAPFPAVLGDAPPPAPTPTSAPTPTPTPTPAPTPARPWASATVNGRERPYDDIVEDGRHAALLEVEQARSHIASWRRTLRGFVKGVQQDLHDATGLQAVEFGPAQAVATFEGRDEATTTPDGPLTAHMLLGPHVTHLVDDLRLAGFWWQAALEEVRSRNVDRDAAVAAAQEADLELVKALRHALYLTFLADISASQVGQRGDPFRYCAGWELDDDRIEEVWSWVCNDGLRLGEQRLPLVLDAAARCVYRKPKGPVGRIAAAGAPLWGGALALGAVAALFAVLDEAGLTSWPAENPGWKLVVLGLFVAFGAVAHLGSQALNINYDSPIGVTAAGGVGDWLALRWLGVLRAYLPVAVVIATLWGAGNIPDSFQELGTAMLAGYSADSLFRAGLQRLASKSETGGGTG